jgi:hypothetical protein
MWRMEPYCVNRKGKVILVHAMQPMQRMGTVEVYLHSCLTLGLLIVEWSTPGLSHFTLRKVPRYPLHLRPSGLQDSSIWMVLEKIKSLVPARIRALYRSANGYSVYWLHNPSSYHVVSNTYFRSSLIPVKWLVHFRSILCGCYYNQPSQVYKLEAK